MEDVEIMMNKEILIKEYCTALENGQAAVFAGAGLSVAAGFVDWKGLLKDIAESLDVKITPDTNLVDLAQYYVNERKNITELSNTILKAFPKETKPTDKHVVLASLPINVYWTTNFDKLIEKALDMSEKVYNVKSTPKSITVSKPGKHITIYKMHGDVDNPAETILTRDHFDQYPNSHQAFLNCLNYDLANNTFLFLGLSFNDPNIKYILKYVRFLYRENQRTHYYILKKIEKDSNESDEQFQNRERIQELFVEDLKNYGIQTVLIENYSEINEILVAIQKRYLRKTVFISGAAHEYSPYTEDEFKNFIKDLSADLIRNGYRIVNGYGLGMGNEVIDGALRALNELRKPIDGNLIIRPFPQGDKAIKKKWAEYRKDMISKTGVTLFLIGNKLEGKSNKLVLSDGMKEEYDISKEHGNFLIPVGATGSMAKELYKKQMAEIDDSNSQYNKYKKDFKKLGDSKMSLAELHKHIMNLLIKASSE